METVGHMVRDVRVTKAVNTRATAATTSKRNVPLSPTSEISSCSITKKVEEDKTLSRAETDPVYFTL